MQSCVLHAYVHKQKKYMGICVCVLAYPSVSHQVLAPVDLLNSGRAYRMSFNHKRAGFWVFIGFYRVFIGFFRVFIVFL